VMKLGPAPEMFHVERPTMSGLSSGVSDRG
jgi:hypothetical protein